MNATAKKPNTNVLKSDVNHALNELVRLSKKLVDFADRETQSLITGDHLGFAFAQHDKEDIASRYAKASEEFRERLDEFRGADKSVLMQLDRLQNELKEKTQNNRVLIEQIKIQALANTQSTLFTAQELGQRVRFPEKNHEQNETERAS